MIALATAIATASASADVGVQLITTKARAGEIARLRALAPARMPLYLVTAARAPHSYRCRKNAICEPRSLGPPSRWPYVRLRVLSRTRAGVVRARVPAALEAGRYRAVLYCGTCYRGPAGSLIVSGNSLVVTR
jgi:hypothetical protein